MGSGESGRYYTSHGSNRVHHGALIHSFDGRFTRNPRTGKIQNIKSGGHGESALEVMGKNGIKYNIVKTYLNGVRVGNIPSIKDRAKKQGTGMAWFPKTWTTRNMVRAGEPVSGLKHNRGVKDGVIIWETYKGVRVGVIKTNGQVATVFPDARYQPVRKKWEEALMQNDKYALFHQVIHERMTNPNAKYYADPWWDAEVKQFTVNIQESIEFIQNECTDEELYWLGEVFDDIMDKTRSSALLDSLQQRVQSVKNPEWKQCLMEDIRTASEYIQ